MDTDATRQKTLWDDWAASFDEYNAQSNSAPAVNYLAAARPGGRYLEMGVGTGRIALEIARRGTSITGIDVSSEMLDILRSKRGDLPVSVIQGDMLSAHVEGLFDCVYAVQSTLFQLTTQQRQVAFFARCAEIMTNDGVLIIESSVPHPGILNPSKNLVLRDIEPGRTRITAMTSNSATQTLRVQELSLTNNEPVSSHFVEQRYCWPSEMDLMAQLAGLQLTSRFGGFTDQPFERSSTTQVSTYEKADARST